MWRQLFCCLLAMAVVSGCVQVDRTSKIKKFCADTNSCVDAVVEDDGLRAKGYERVQSKSEYDSYVDSLLADYEKNHPLAFVTFGIPLSKEGGCEDIEQWCFDNPERCSIECCLNPKSCEGEVKGLAYSPGGGTGGEDNGDQNGGDDNSGDDNSGDTGGDNGGGDQGDNGDTNDNGDNGDGGTDGDNGDGGTDGDNGDGGGAGCGDNGDPHGKNKGGDKPGWGKGDKNHSHTGPPGLNNKGSKKGKKGHK